jgi:hypothetical protein
MATTVTVGGTAATDVQVTSATELTAVVPAGTAGPADVVVSTSAGSDTLADGYTYIEAPTATAIDPANGPEAGGTTVTLTGTGFTAGATVTVGGTAATDVTVVSATEITFVTPAGTGTGDVVVTTDGGSDTLTDAFTYDPALSVTAVDPDSGPAAGGNTITITGTGFETA